MVIQKVIIHRFGKHIEQSWSFQEGVNILVGPNEWGKSTFFAFVRAMLYGLGGRGTESERKRYTPWSGGEISGELLFTHQNVSYRAIATYGASKRADKIHIYREASGEELLLPPSQTLGEYFLGLSAGAFDSSLYIGQQASKMEPGQDKEGLLLQKLSALSGQGEGETSVKEVEKRLKRAMDSLRAPRSGNGVLDLLLQKESFCQEKLALLDQTEEKAIQLREQRDQIQKKLQETDLALAEQKKRKEWATAALLLQQKQEILEKKHDLSLEEEKGAGEDPAYWNGEMKRLEDAQTALQQSLATNKAQDKADREALLTLEKDLERAHILRSTPEPEAVHKPEDVTPEEGKKLSPAVLTFFLAGGLLAVVALLLGVLAKQVFPVVLFAVGALLCLGLGFCRKKQQARMLTQQKVEKEAADAWLRRKEQEEREALDQRILRLADEIQERKERVLRLHPQMEQEQKELLSLQQAWAKAKETWQRASVQQGRREKAEALLRQLLAGRSEEEWEILWREAEANLGEEAMDALSLPQETLRAQQADATERLSAIQEEHRRLTANLSYQQASLDALYPEGREDSYSALYQELQQTQEHIALYQRKYQALERFQEMIGQAFTEMQTKFGPILAQSTGEILSRITGGKHKQVRIAKDFSVTVWDDIEPHDSSCYSGATIDQMYFALRLALSDLIRPAGEEPYPLFLDDPFVQYDLQREDQALRFLQEYSKEKKVQIILASCRLERKDTSL